MTLAKYLMYMLVSTVFAWIAWFLVLSRVDPRDADLLGFAIFYLSLWFASVGTLALVGFFLRRLMQREVYSAVQVVIAFRQGLFLSVLLVVSLFLQSMRILTWWNLLVFVGALTLLEYFFSTRKQNI